MHEAF